MEPKIWYLYTIQNKTNGKIYVGQAINISKRWSNHKRAIIHNHPTQPIHFAMIKYGVDNFEFKVIASCRSQDDANFTETELVSQYDSFVGNGNGYNATLGGMNAPKTEEWKIHMSKIMKIKSKERIENETPEAKIARYAKVSETLSGRPRVPGSGVKKGAVFPDRISSKRKLTQEQVDLIIEQYEQGLSKRELARQFSIDRTTITSIVTGKSYRRF